MEIRFQLRIPKENQSRLKQGKERDVAAPIVSDTAMMAAKKIHWIDTNLRIEAREMVARG